MPNREDISKEIANLKGAGQDIVSMKPDKRLDVKLSLTITDQGKPYSSSLITWDDVPYIAVLEIEKKLIAFMAEMNQLGYTTLNSTEN